ncbi:bifunctional diguanylate cyclase/phosphodiesterase [Magnetospira sp. QH-2]|uniref:bifunctional diguanylate cyclase/phosphodiesterase n=1 Tax=Magnetospira sp. (strain QH-2) TaxID=1288970 RepID=UPI0003E80E85|nr:bifunctional diguanylate cyclase/phosphodiesterase [Magnetospira sp. QH-2]CCQ75056.1 putative Diguanylate cyclase/phosphodiesterase with PAS sensor domain [Magnetospira sp. QH-2]
MAPRSNGPTDPDVTRFDPTDGSLLTLLEISPAPVAVIVGIEQEVVFLNNKFIETFGYGREDLPDVNHWWPLAYPDPDYRETVRGEWRHRVERALAEGKTIEPMEAVVRCKDGKRRIVAFNAASSGDLTFILFNDLTDRRGMGSYLQNMQARLEKAQALAGIGSWDWEPESNRLRFSIQAQAILGVPSETIGEGFQALLRITGPDCQDEVAGAIENCLAGFGPMTLEHEIHQADGTRLIVRHLAERAASDKEGTVRLEGVIQDITDARRIQSEIRDSEERFRTLVETTWAVPWRIDVKSGHFTYVGTQIEDLFGYPKESWIDIPAWSARIHPDDRTSALYHCISEAHRRREHETEYRLMHQNGKAIWVREVTAVVDTHHGTTEMVGYFLDITDSKNTEAELRKERDFTDAVLATIGSLVVVLDRAGTIVQFNDACAKLTRYKAAEALGQKVWNLVLPPEKLAEVEEVFRNLKAGQFPNRHVNPWLDRDGQEHLIDWSNTALLDDDGEVEFVIATGIDITNQHQMQKERDQLIEMSQDFVCSVTQEGEFRLINSAFEKTLGFDRQSMMARPIWDFIDPRDRERTRDAFEVLKKGIPVNNFEIRLLTKNGGTRWTSWCGTPDPETGLSFNIGRDITETRAAQAALNQAARVFEHTREGILVTGADRRIQRVNKAFESITGYSEWEVIGKRPQDFISSGHHDNDFYEKMWREIEDTGNWTGEVWNRRCNGEVFPAWQNITAVTDTEGTTIQYIGIFSDITEKKDNENRIQRLAHYDVLTDLPNRLLYTDRLAHALDRARRTNGLLALLFIDLDRFKNVNDSLGHQMGDLMLQTLAARLSNCLRDSDTVARLGGDEFTVIIEDVDTPEEVGITANKILAALRRPVDLRGQEAVVGASIGISLYPRDGTTAEELVKHADTAMYQAKDKGRDRTVFYTPDLTQGTEDRFRLEGQLRNAVENGEMEVYYQPQVNMESGRLVGAEALVRWHHPTDGLVLPTRFIPLAEETGLIHSLGRWVLRTACFQGKEWADKGLPVRIAVNVSNRQIMQGDMVRTVTQALADSGLPASMLELEVTESFVMENPEMGVHTLNLLHDLGVWLAIDDFGTGYSSFSYLKRLPVERLKIDRSFIMDIPDDKEDEAISAAIIAMAHELGMGVTAEGVETVEQMDFLRPHGCEESQGFLVSRPVPAPEFEVLARDLHPADLPPR